MQARDNPDELWERFRAARAEVEAIWDEIDPPGTSVSADQVRRLQVAKATREAAEHRWRQAMAAQSAG